MNEITCPHCSKAFKIDEAGYADILKQVRNQEFDVELHQRLETLTQEHKTAIKLAQAEIKNQLEKTAAQKDAQIEKLNGKLKAAEVAKELALKEALINLEKERDSLTEQVKQSKQELKHVEKLAILFDCLSMPFRV